MNNSRLFRLSRIVIALTAASGMMVNTANATDEAKAATNIPNRLIRITPNHYRLAIVRILTMLSVDLSLRCWMKVFCAMLMANHIIAEKIINLISMRPRPKPLTQACGVSRRSTAFLACLKSPTACIRCAARYLEHHLH